MILPGLLLALFGLSRPTLAEDAMTRTTAAPLPVALPAVPAHTFSIVARDPKTGDFGVAVQSHYFSTGGAVPWAEAGVGAVATQSFVEMSYGPKGLKLMKGGLDAAAALRTLVEADSGRAVRQVAFVDAAGRAAAHTGASCIEAAGHHVGAGYSVQANLMDKDTVWGSMATAYEASVASGRGDLADHLLAALEAAQAEGGDIRGQQSCALLVVKAKASATPWDDRLYDLRVEDNPLPLKELRRLIDAQRAYRKSDEGDRLVEKQDFVGAARAYAESARLAPPGNVELKFWQAVALWKIDHRAEALPIFAEVFAAPDGANWRRLVPRLVKPGLFPDDPKALAEIAALPAAGGQ